MLEIILIISIINLVQQYKIDKQEKEIKKLKIVVGTLIGKVFLNKDLDDSIEITYDGKVIK